jgi:hypothetical protein
MDRHEAAQNAFGEAGRSVHIDDSALTVLGPDDASDLYDIRYCARRRYLQIRMFGEWDGSIFDRFAADYRAAISRFPKRGGVTYVLADGTTYPIQPPEVAERFPDLIVETASQIEQRTACVVPNLVNRVQSRTGGDLINARYFRTAEDAVDWLFSDEA